jgi:hypothetical protein
MLSDRVFCDSIGRLQFNYPYGGKMDLKFGESPLSEETEIGDSYIDVT